MEEVKKQRMESLFCPYEQALKLKELGFDEPCFAFYGLSRDDYKTIRLSIFQNLKTDYLPDIHHLDVTCDAPLFQQAFRFFREKYNIHYAMKPILGSKNGYDSFPILGWDYDIFITNKGTQNSYYMGYPVGEWFTATLDMFDESETLEDLDIHPLTYEEAELECLVKLIDIVKKQNVKYI